MSLKCYNFSICTKVYLFGVITVRDRIIELKNKIANNSFSSREDRFDSCNELLTLTLKENSKDDIAFAYLSLASYYANVAHDMTLLSQYMQKTREYLSMEPSVDLIAYYTLKALSDDTTFDLLSRLDCYLEIIRIAEILNIESKAFFAYGNIAELFRLCQDYETALEYSIETYDKYMSSEENYANNKVITLTNIVELLNHIGKVDDVPFYISEIEKLNWESKVYPILLNICYLRLYSMQKDKEKAVQLNQKLLTTVKEFPANKNFKYDCVINMAEAMMYVEAFDEVLTIVEYMEELFSSEDVNEWLQIQKIKIEYYEKTHNEDNLKYQYINFIKAYENVETENQSTKIAGIRAHIEIQNIIKHEEKLLDDNASLRTDSLVDVMTQLYNRRYINTFLMNISDDQKLKSIGFAILDVDYFKEYNDTYGHIKGDQVLIEISNIIRSIASLSPDCIKACRIGGDEFFCIFLNTSEDEVETYIKEAVNQLSIKAIQHETSKCANRVTLSIGFGVEEMTPDFNPQRLLEKIDAVLYNSKRSGRNTYSKYVSEGENHDE